VVVLAMALIVVTLAVAVSMRPVDLAEVLLIVLVEVIGVSLVAGRAVAAAAALGASLAINWFLIPPYGTLHVTAEEDWVFLMVFLVMAVGSSTLVESVLTSERAAARVAAHESVLAEVLGPAQVSAIDALRLMRTAVDLDEVALIDASSGRLLLSTLWRREPPYPACLQLDIAPGFRVRGWGPRRLGVQSDYVTTLATAVVRAWESEQLAAERGREAVGAPAGDLASVSDQLRAPLARIGAALDSMEADGGDLTDADRRDLVDRIRHETDRLDAIVEAGLDPARR
jgi:two-component system, OmpR family, sensor histidine kinase KdpD